MIAAMCLLAYAWLLLTVGASRLARAGWPDRAPKLAIAAWLALNGSAVSSVILGGVALVVPTARVSYHLAGLLAACVLAVQARYAHPGGAALAGAGVVLAVAVAARLCWCTARTLAMRGGPTGSITTGSGPLAARTGSWVRWWSTTVSLPPTACPEPASRSC